MPLKTPEKREEIMNEGSEKKISPATDHFKSLR
jgi:hypothetical protein